ncbi:MAG: TIGR00725 family protein [Candidatus Zixiibacteriota bacterium]
MNNKSKIYIAVIGAGKCTGKVARLAEEVGHEIALRQGILICGGFGGVMESACKGSHKFNGLTIGILPGDSKDEANEYIDIAIATGIGEARNLAIIKTADVVIALPGKFGTLSEMAFCMKLGKPIVSLGDWDISKKIEKFDNAQDAVERAFELARGK